jgi:signal transduction histidine kinase
MRNLWVTILCVLVGFPCLLFAQDSGVIELDSLKTSILIDSLNKAAFSKKNTNISEALVMVLQIKDLAQKINYHKGLSSAYYTEAGIFQQNGFNKRAHLLYEIALDNSVKYNDSTNIPLINLQIAAFDVSEGKMEEGIKLYNQCLDAFIKMGMVKDVANTKNSLGLIEIKKNNYSKAELLFKEALQLSLTLKFVYGQKKSFYNLGLLARAKKDTAIARSYFENSLSLDNLLKDNYGMALNQIQMVQLLLEQQKTIEAISMAKIAYENANKIHAYNLMITSITILKDAYKAKNDLPNTNAWQDSLINTLKLKGDNEVEYANSFIELVKDNSYQKLNAKTEIEKANKRATDQLVIISVGSFLLVILALLMILAFVSYRKQMLLSRRLFKQNTIIEENASSLDRLNKEINSKNLLLEEDNRTKDKLLSIISHDLRNPITNTQTILSLINKGALSQEESKVLLEQLETQYINTTGLLDNLLGWLKSQITGKELERSDINIHDLMNGMHLEQKIPLMRKRIKFINITQNDVTIRAEKEMIKIIFRNLITNAIKFTPLDGRIEISFREDDQFDFVMIRDTGIGMSDDVLAKVNAQKYFTRTGTLQEKGSGFGLILCRDLLQKQGGNLLIESAKGEGSLFTVQLPKAKFN